MSLQQAHAFYEFLMSDEATYEEYFKKCCGRGLMGSCHWDKNKITNFASTLGYDFTESELEQLWFEGEANAIEQMSIA
jgi:hypothetical protein